MYHFTSFYVRSGDLSVAFNLFMFHGISIVFFLIPCVCLFVTVLFGLETGHLPS